MQKCTENAWASLKVVQEHHGILGQCAHKANCKGILGSKFRIIREALSFRCDSHIAKTACIIKTWKWGGW